MSSKSAVFSVTSTAPSSRAVAASSRAPVPEWLNEALLEPAVTLRRGGADEQFVDHDGTQDDVREIGAMEIFEA